ncbi:lipoprotein [Spiroplasma endosymbiont of Panorpa germanica]|uniref:lipoprotein n=1 Tax=Spiroplasma endosymbiont of Panorpa germanica TaxID=3066314 RepID=UPI0030CD4C4A
MRKLLAILASTSLISAAGVTVVSCTNELSNYNTFKKWIKKRETFILYIGAEDCPYCQNFVKSATGKPDGNLDEFENQVNNGDNKRFNDLTETYNNTLSDLKDKNNQTEIEDEFRNGFGAKVDKVQFHHFTEEKKETVQSKKWLTKIKEWILDEYKEQYKIHNVPETDPNYVTKDLTIDDLKINSIPVYLIIRDGKLVNIVSGFDSLENGVGPEQAMDNLFNEFTSYFTDPGSFFQPTSTGGETGGEDGDGDGGEGIDETQTLSPSAGTIPFEDKIYDYRFQK